MNPTRTKMTNGKARRMFGPALLTLVLMALSAQLRPNFALAQELTAEEQMPLGGELAPIERVMSEESLRFAAELAVKRWKALEAEPSAGSFDAYFEIFREVARIESFEQATKIAGVDVRSPLVMVASTVLGEMKANGLSARGAGIRALESLVAKLEGTQTIDDADSLKVRYTLVLDYMSGIDVTRLAVAIADGLGRSNRPDMALDVYSNFLTYYFERLPTAQERLELITLASARASGMVDPAAFRVLTDLLRMAPRAEKVNLAQVAFQQVDTNVIARLSADASNSNLLLAAWLKAAESVQGLKSAADIATLREQARDSLETPAFEILSLAEKDETTRNRIVSDAVLADVSQNRAMVGYDRALNLDLAPEQAPEAYFALLQSFAADGYVNYVRSLARQIAEQTEAGRLVLSAEQTTALLLDVETTADPDFVLSLAPAFPNLSADLERIALRAGIRTIFTMPVDQAIGSTRISVGKGVNQALLTAASLANGDLPAPASIAALAPSPEDDLSLLSAVAERLWQYGERRSKLIDFMASKVGSELKQAVAIGVTGFMGFEAGEGAGGAFALEVGKLLPSTTGEAKALLAASIGQVAEPGDLSAEALQRYARYLAATGQSIAALTKVAGEQASLATVSAAVFTDIEPATDHIKKVENVRDRVREFRRLAEARASVLDNKGWLNSASHPTPTASSPLGVSLAGISDGRISAAAAADKDAVPASRRPFMPNLLLGRDAVASKIPVPMPRDSNAALADISKRGETPATRLIRFSSEHFEGIINLGVREYLYLNSDTTFPRIIFVTRGVMTMSELIGQVRATAPDAITVEDGHVTFNVPLAVNDGASLIVSGQEIRSLRLNTKAGAFLVNSGKIYFDNVTVSSFDTETGQPSYVQGYEKGVFFRPFILSWSGSETYAVDSSFVALGYSGGRTYGMSLSSGPTDAVARQVESNPPPTGYFINNSFDNLYYGFYVHEAEDIVFVGNELVDGVIYGLDPHDFSQNLMMAYNTAYGTQKKHGIIISREVDDSFIVGNLSFDNRGTGIMLDRRSYGTVVYANDASRNDGDGFSALESPCVLVENNMFYANGRSGVKIRNSWDVHVESNQIMLNKSAGIEVYIDNLEQAAQSEFRDFKKDAYSAISTVTARDNVISSNRVGMIARGASEARFLGNRFIDQLPRYVGGDLKPLALDIVAENMRSGVVVRSICMPRIPMDKECSLARDGVISAQSMQPEFGAAQGSIDLCVNTAGSPQSAAFNAPEGE